MTEARRRGPAHRSGEGVSAGPRQRVRPLRTEELEDGTERNIEGYRYVAHEMLDTPEDAIAKACKNPWWSCVVSEVPAIEGSLDEPRGARWAWIVDSAKLSRLFAGAR